MTKRKNGIEGFKLGNGKREVGRAHSSRRRTSIEQVTQEKEVTFEEADTYISTRSRVWKGFTVTTRKQLFRLLSVTQILILLDLEIPHIERLVRDPKKRKSLRKRVTKTTK